ncbi:serine/threonine-protein kinase [Amycolatopsis saalfeldensis]|uniref:non-specific serine/threonine protein kinase n=1 Tax=Amycolatopsis saalfeldensis TaxID=394193 RepID=A0A1H8YLP8_9PSEU|nr:serine/threonine-protein kinase [Amycolatopsis saalfeldensis]SEP52993.1 Serine/threonine protein kinase [Amycolatopsis saalfeldensis]
MLIADRYEVDELPLGRGGMGAVHRGHDRRLGRRVAIKLLRLPGRDEELEERFAREARILATLDHAGVPALYDFGTHDDRLFQVMQFVEGVTVADLLAEHGPLPVPWAAAIAAQATAVLSAAHARSVCHRDLKPANLMLCPDGSVKVMDFGLAVLREADVARFTRAGQLLGTPSYMAPEQIQRGLAEPRSDLYALGCVLHEMLTGKQLFTGPTAYAVFDKQVKDAPPAVLGVPPALNAVLASTLAKDPEERPAGADVLYARLTPFVRDLPPLPGFLHPASVPSPARMYARMVGRMPS